ncbi:hypothetical protein F4803DRAFT_542287 [Xylaria telfairii]|nr:hypothetical protein F4803DRAFT_542287 [Xylaria telfairii]
MTRCIHLPVSYRYNMALVYLFLLTEYEFVLKLLKERERKEELAMTVICSPDEKHVSSAKTTGLLPLDQLMVVRQGEEEGKFQSSAESLVDLPAGAIFAHITGVTVISGPRWSSVQAGKNLHIELNSILVYVNHSCIPTLEFDMERMEVRVSRNRDLKKGDLLSFFYPSTEFKMKQSFDCWCGAGEKCFGRIEGAAKLGAERLSGYWINRHIKEIFEEASNNKGNGYHT